MTEARPSAWLGVYPGEGVYLGVGETGRRFRKVEDINKTIRSLEEIIGASGNVRALAMPNVFIRISEGRICIQIYGETSASFDEDHAVDLLDQLKLLRLICQSPTGREALGFPVEPKGAEQIIKQFNDPGTLRVKCDQCGAEMEAASSSDVPITRDGKTVAHTYTVGFECPGCDNEIWIPMYKWRFKE